MGNIHQQFEYVTSGTPKRPQKLVVLLHGYGRDASLMEKTAAEIAALMPEARIVMPQAPEECGIPETDEGNILRVPRIIRDDEAAAEGSRRQWFSIDGGLEEIRSKLVDAARKINQFIDEQRDLLALRDSDIAIMGFSQGGAVALCAAFMRAADLGCAVGHSTIFPDTGNFTAHPPVLYLYGTTDEEFPLPIYEDSARRLQSCTDDLTIRIVPGLGHRTNAESRQRVARYIAARLQ